MKVTVNRDLCICTTLCEQICPEVFQIEGNVSRVQVEEVPPELEETCRRAAESCPTGAIRIAEQ